MSRLSNTFCNRIKNVTTSARDQQSNQIERWSLWRTYQRPRIVRLRSPFWSVFLLVTLLAVPSLVTAFLIVEWRHSPERQVSPDLWSALPFILLPIALLVVNFWILIAHRRLVRTGELALAQVIGMKSGRRGPTIRYEFSDRSGRLISASSPDNSRTISVGMIVPVFYNPENPEGDQVALCGSFYEVSNVSARQRPG